MLKIFIIPLLLLYSIINVQSVAQSKKYTKRIEYLSTQHLYVTLFTLNQDSLNTMNPVDKRDLIKLNKKANENLKHVFDTFWNLSDTIIYSDYFQIESLKKQNRGAAFIEYLSYGPFTSARINIPKKKSMFSDVIGQFLSGDSSFVEIATEVRSLKLHVTNGTFLNNKNLGSKVILTCKNLAHNNQAQLGYLESIKSQFPNSYLEVSEEVIINAIIKKDPKYLYVYSLSTYNAEDGSMIKTR